MWILKGSPSLQEINTRLRDIRSAVDRQREQLLDASGAINEATADFNRDVPTTVGQEVEGHKSGIVKRLEIRIAEGGRIARESFDAVSPSITDFEDIDAYVKEERYDGYFDDDESVFSAKTV
jgi:hypothetical protein